MPPQSGCQNLFLADGILGSSSLALTFLEEKGKQAREPQLRGCGLGPSRLKDLSEPTRFCDLLC